jgi:hypothetical protein
VIAGTLHSSFWPTVLRSDETASQGVHRKVQLIRWVITLTAVLLPIAASITPLGLYEKVAPDQDTTLVSCHYVKDISAFGIGTDPRPSEGFSRLCDGSNFGDPGSRACLNSGYDTTSTNNTSVDPRIPRKYAEFLESGVSGSELNQTVSSAFDIQWRTWQIALNDTLALTNISLASDNISDYAIGAYRTMSNVLLNQAWDAIEGLIVDSKSGGVGFRNHTIPTPNLPYGAQWSEDILFVEPVTECVNLNLSIDYWLVGGVDSQVLNIFNARLVDHGGFANFPRSGIPYIAIGNQTNPLLAERAQTGAWILNMLMMLMWNVTDMNIDGTVTIAPPFSYLNSEIGNEIWLPIDGTNNFSASDLSYDRLRTYFTPEDFLNDVGLFSFVDASGSGIVSNFTIGNFSDNFTQLPTNPFNLTTLDTVGLGELSEVSFVYLLSRAGVRCSGLLNDKSPSFHTMAGICGPLIGIPRRKDGSNTVSFEANTEWTTPIYSCASASRALVKTVDFGYNTSSSGLKGLFVRDVREKSYSSPSEYPLWASETSSNWTIQSLRPLWGIVSNTDDSIQNIEYTRAPQLWLSSDFTAQMGGIFDNIPASEFPGIAMNEVYGMSSDPSSSIVGDYSGATNLDLYTTWKDLSDNATGVEQILNLIWTDIAANAVVGTRGRLPLESIPNLSKRSDESQDAKIPVYVLNRSTRYHIIYAIPAFFVLGLLVLALIAAFVAMIRGHGTVGRVRMYLLRLSSGRLMTMANNKDDRLDETATATGIESTSRWVQRRGRTMISVSNTIPAKKEGLSEHTTNFGEN